MSGYTNYRAGLSAEDTVSAQYEAQGFVLQQTRWRGPGGEIDLILAKDGMTVFVEVKRARDFETAAARILPAQMARIWASAEAYLGTLPAGADSACRIDVALVDGQGRVQVIENAFQ